MCSVLCSVVLLSFITWFVDLSSTIHAFGTLTHLRIPARRRTNPDIACAGPPSIGDSDWSLKDWPPDWSMDRIHDASNDRSYNLQQKQRANTNNCQT